MHRRYMCSVHTQINILTYTYVYTHTYNINVDNNDDYDNDKKNQQCDNFLMMILDSAFCININN